MKKIIHINLYDYLNVENLNKVLDDKIKDGFATDISYKVKKVSSNGNLTIEATFTKERI